MTATLRPGRLAHAVDVLGRRVDQGHLPQRPSWQCTGCDQPWPCSPARVQLGEAYGLDRIGLAMYVATLLEQAAAEVDQHVTPRELYERFVAWTR